MRAANRAAHDSNGKRPETGGERREPRGPPRRRSRWPAPRRRQCCCCCLCCSLRGARRGGAAARGGGPDDEENDALPEGVDKRYFSASAAQQAFFTEVLPDALAGRGGWHLGSGYYSYKPTGCVELGGDMRTVGVSELTELLHHSWSSGEAGSAGHGELQSALLALELFDLDRRVAGARPNSGQIQGIFAFFAQWSPETLT